MKGFASDNYAGVSPQVMEAMVRVNGAGHQPAYGADEFTLEAKRHFKHHFGEQAEVFFVMNGTGSNVTALSALCQSYQAVVCTDVAHLNNDECAAPEKIIGGKLKAVPTQDGKLTPEQVMPLLGGRGEHQAIPKVISITQATELGTLYTVDEIQALAELAHQNGLYLHVDGARIANAAVSLGVSFKEMLVDTGVDVVSFGGTKNGMMMGEAVVFLRPGLETSYRFIRKQSMQLLSKMRYVGAQFCAYFEQELWKKNAEHANRMATLLADELSKVEELRVTQKVQANGVFVELPVAITPAMQEVYPFYIWNEQTNEVRLMTSFDTKEEEVQGFISLLKEQLCII